MERGQCQKEAVELWTETAEEYYREAIQCLLENP